MSESHLNESSQSELLKLLHARQGHFRLESGHHGNLWLDLDLLILRPKAIEPFITELARKIAPFGVDALCGPMVGGALVAQNIALALGADFLYTGGIISLREICRSSPLLACPMKTGRLKTVPCACPKSPSTTRVSWDFHVPNVRLNSRNCLLTSDFF